MCVCNKPFLHHAIFNHGMGCIDQGFHFEFMTFFHIFQLSSSNHSWPWWMLHQSVFHFQFMAFYILCACFTMPLSIMDKAASSRGLTSNVRPSFILVCSLHQAQGSLQNYDFPLYLSVVYPVSVKHWIGCIEQRVHFQFMVFLYTCLFSSPCHFQSWSRQYQAQKFLYQ